MHGEYVAGGDATHVDGADDRVEEGRRAAQQGVHVRIVDQAMHGRLVAVVRDEAGQGVVGLDLEGFTERDFEYGFVAIVESVTGHRPAVDLLHALSPSLASWCSQSIDGAGCD